MKTFTFGKHRVAPRMFQLAVRLSLATTLAPLSTGAGKVKPAPAPAATVVTQRPALSPEQEESRALDEAFKSAAGNPQALIQNLEKFLARYPQSSRRQQVLRTIYKQALQANDPATAAEYAEKLLELNPKDFELLSALVDLLERQSDAASGQKAIQYASRFIERAGKLGSEPRPSDVAAEKWAEMQALLRATGYLMRAKLYAKSGENVKARADYEMSFAAYPTSQAAERLGDLAAKNGETDRAIDDYATAFALPDKSADPAHRDEVRRKLGSLYLAKYRSEKGLGDLILAHYDELFRTLKSRFAGRSSPNGGARDPFEYTLVRLNGAELRLRDLRGKVVVMDFWATWCGPCRLEGKLLESVVRGFRNQPDATFLAVNVDEDRAGVADFVREERWTVPVVYAEGLDHLLGVRALPTLLIFDRGGRVVFRLEGLDPEDFTAVVEQKVRAAMKQPASSSAHSP